MDTKLIGAMARIVSTRASRRIALTSTLALPFLRRTLSPVAADGNSRRKRKSRRARRRCFAGQKCAPGQGRNNANCDYFSSMAFHQGIAQGANLSNANFTVAQLIGTNLQGANLSGVPGRRRSAHRPRR